MFKNWLITDLTVIALLLEEEERRTRESNSQQKRKKWVHKSLIWRKTEGEFFTLYKELVYDEEKFHQYFWMSEYQFKDFLSRIEPLKTKKNTTFQHVMVTDEEKTFSPTMYVAVWRQLDVMVTEK
jgi:hypothetical protein